MLYSGVDISEATFTASAFREIDRFLLVGKDYDQTNTGFSDYLKDLRVLQQRDEPITICMETTGFYSERLCQYLYGKTRLSVSVEPAQHVKRAFRLKGKTDKADSKQIAEYAYRFSDVLRQWTPPPQAVEDMRELITSRMKFKQDEVAHRNRVTSYSHLARPMKTIHLHEKAIALFKASLKDIEQDMKDVLKSDPEIAFHAQNLMTIKCIGLHCVSGFLVVTHGFRRHDHLKLAGLLGLAPRKHLSGTSIRGKDETDRYGHLYLSVNLHLASKSACNHVEHFREYFSRLRQKGKEKKLIYNNVSYKLLKRMCVVIRERRPYHAEAPIPKFLQKKS